MSVAITTGAPNLATNTPEPTPLPRSSADVPFVYRCNYPSGIDELALKLMRSGMLKLINDAGSRVRVGQVTLGNNPSPQSHAEFMRDGFTVSH